MRRHASVDHDRLTCDVRPCIAYEKDQRGGKFYRLTKPTQDARHLRFDVARGELLGHLAGKEAGRERIDPDSFASGPLLRQVGRQSLAALGCGGYLTLTREVG
jgi:hypothetical protein